MSEQIEAWRKGLLSLVLQYARAYADNSDPAKTEAAYVAICDYLGTTPNNLALVPVEPTDANAQVLRSVSKSWDRLNLALMDGEGSPYPGMARAFETRYGVSWADPSWRNEAATWAAAWKTAKDDVRDASQKGANAG